MDTAGFELLTVPTPLSTAEFYDAEAVIGRYYDECCELLRSHVGAARVVAFDHNVRNSGQDLFADKKATVTRGAIEPDGPVMFVHNDYTDVCPGRSASATSATRTAATRAPARRCSPRRTPPPL